MVSVSILNWKGHEKFEKLSAEEAEKLINDTIDANGQRYFVIDKNTRAILKEIKLQPEQDVVLIPIVAGG